VTTIHALLLCLLLTAGYRREKPEDLLPLPLLGEDIPVELDDDTVGAMSLPPAPPPDLPGPEPGTGVPEPPPPEPPTVTPPTPAPPVVEPPVAEPPAPPPPKVEPKPEPKPEPPKAEPKPEPEPEPVPAKVEPKAVPPRVEPKTVPKPKPEPKPEPPKAEPKAVPKTQPPKAEPKTVPKPQPPKVEPKTVPSPQPAKAEPKPQAPKTGFRTAEDIRKSASVTPVPGPVGKPGPSLPVFDARSIAGNLQKGLEAVRIESVSGGTRAGSRSGSPTGSRTGSRAGSPAGRATGGADEARWHAALSAELYRLWAQPSRADVGGGNPAVRVTLSITAEGRVVDARITGPSHVVPMTTSVKRLLDSLGTVPAPKSYGVEGSPIVITVTFKLTT